MSEHRLFVANHLDYSIEITLEDNQAHYLRHVLRLSEGARLLVFNGSQGEWRAEIKSAKKSVCVIRIVEKMREQTAAQDVQYAFAPLKQARLDYMIQKAVELGASSLQPVMTAHTVVHRLNLDRIRANVVEAAEQCGILTLPDVVAPLKLEDFIERQADGRVVIFCDERTVSGSPLDALAALKGRRVTALVGPEGGFAEEERSMLLSKDFVVPISLGPRVMRADTAAVAVLAMINAVLGDWTT